jgi:IS605 OrfB family transposase
LTKDINYPIFQTVKLTVKIKLLPTEQQKQSLLKTMQAFNDACNYISQIAFKNRRFSQVPLHRLCYRDVRQKFKLSAQLAVRAIDKVAQTYKLDKKKLHRFKKYSAVVYDQRLLSFRGLSIASILTIDGRYKIPIVFGSYAGLEQNKMLGQADLVYKNGKLLLHVVIELPDGAPLTPKSTLGVDFGIANLATTSDGDTFSGKTVDDVRTRITAIKKALQKRGTKSAKRHLKKLSDRERRFKHNTNHAIAKKIVQIAKDTQRAIALENLSGFRVTVRKEQRERLGKWAFGELGGFVAYKAKLAGVRVVFVEPRNTSRTCSHCGHVSRSNRKSQSEFVCAKCSFSIHADLNAAINIASRASVNTPIAVHLSSATTPVPGTASCRMKAVSS